MRTQFFAIPVAIIVVISLDQSGQAEKPQCTSDRHSPVNIEHCTAYDMARTTLIEDEPDRKRAEPIGDQDRMPEWRARTASGNAF
jgi:hypothetical protein